MKKEISNAPLANFQVHPEVEKTYRPKDLDCLRFLLNTFGQRNPVEVIERSGQMYIIDGVSRFNCARQLQLPSLIYQVVEVDDSKIMEYRLLSNVKIKRTFTEMCREVEYVLDLIGSSQGKKRDLMGFADFLNDKYYGEIGKDRFELACALLDIELRASTLRKAMRVYFSEFNPDGKSESGIIELLDEGSISIDKAYKLVCDRDKKKRQKEDTDKAKIMVAQSNLDGGDKPYKLYNKSSIKMDEVPDDSLSLIIDSHPYWQLRDYRNQDEMLHGQEHSLDGYIKNFKRFNEEKFRKLKPGGVLATIIGETYRGGYQGVVAAAITAIKEVGFVITDDITWVKSNQKYTPHPYRFQNCKETIIVAYKPGKEPHFRNVYREGSVETFKVRKTSSGGYYIASPETCIPNVIITPAFDSKTLHAIDPEFRHDAPCPPEIYEIIIEAYSRLGDTILDGFVGSGTCGAALKMGRKVIGYDVDPLSIQFSQKRFEWFLRQREEEGDGSLLKAA
jgi:DNA modification methylase